jgi:hypothetical protein
MKQKRVAASLAGVGLMALTIFAQAYDLKMNEKLALTKIIDEVEPREPSEKNKAVVDMQDVSADSAVISRSNKLWRRGEFVRIAHDEDRDHASLIDDERLRGFDLAADVAQQGRFAIDQRRPIDHLGRKLVCARTSERSTPRLLG